MTRSILRKGLLISLIAFTLGLIIWGLNQRKETASPSIINKPSPYPIKIEGISYSTYDDNNRLIARIKADEFKVAPRKFFVFNIRPFNQATLTNAKLEVHLYEEMPTEVDLFSFGKDILSLDKEGKTDLKGMGLITRGVIKGLTLKIYNTDKLSLVVKAKKAYVDFKRKKTRLVIADIEDISSKKLIKSRSVIWDNNEKAFNIPGEYMALTPDGTTKGKGIKIDLK